MPAFVASSSATGFRGRSRLRALAVLGILGVSLSGAIGERADAAITGTVFRDYNQNGVRDNTAAVGSTPGFIEPFVSGIQVAAFNQAGVSVATATTATNGTFSLATTAGRYRVEFSIPGSQSFLQHGPAGSGSGSSVQFVADGTAANFGVANPADYCQTQPSLVTSCHRFGDAGGPNSSERTVVRWPYSASSPRPTNPDGTPNYFAPPSAHASVEELAKHTEVGSTFGLAYHKTSKTLLTAAYMRRHVGFGTGGPMAIYAVPNADAATPGAPTVFADLNDVTGATAAPVTSPHPTGAAAWSSFSDANFSLWFHDANAFDDVGKLGLGGLAVSEDDTTLWAVNLTDRTLVKMDLGTGATPAAPTGAEAFSVPTSLCKNAYAMRPFAVTEHDGLVYVGGVCSGQTSATGKDTTDLGAWVITFNPQTSAWATSPVLAFDSSYSREATITTTGANARFTAWKDTFAEFNTEGFNAHGPGPMKSPKSYQGMLTGITFTGDDMVVAFRSRPTDQFGNLAGDTSASTPKCRERLLRRLPCRRDRAGL